MTKAVFWDFDGTLVRSDHLWSRSVYSVLRELPYGFTFNMVRSHLRTGFSWHMPDVAYAAETGGLWWEKLFRHFDGLYRELGMTRGEMERANAAVRETILSPDNYTLYEDAGMVLARCGALGYRNYILSNNYPELETVIRGMGMADYFDGFIVSACVGYEKPRIELYQHAKKLAGFPDLAYMVGDNPAADIRGGQEAGMTTILVHNMVRSEADYAFETLSEILGIL